MAKLIEIIEGEDVCITEIVKFQLKNYSLEVKQYNFEHLGTILSFFYKMEMITENNLTTLLFKNNKLINNIIL